MPDRDTIDAPTSARRRDDAIAALVCAVLAAIAAILWSTGVAARDDASAAAAAPACSASVSTNCRTLTTATVMDRLADASGATQISLDDGSTVTLDNQAPPAAGLTAGSKVTTVGWKGNVISLVSGSGQVLNTADSPTVASRANSVLIALALAVMCLTALVAMGPRVAAKLAARAERPGRISKSARKAAAAAAAAAAAEPPVDASSGSFAMQATAFGGKASNGPAGVSLSSPSSGMQINPIRSSSGAPRVDAAAAGAPAGQAAQSAQAAPPPPDGGDGLSFAEVSVPSHSIEPPSFRPGPAAARQASAPSAVPAGIEGLSLNPMPAPAAATGSIPLNPMPARVAPAAPVEGLSLNPMPAPAAAAPAAAPAGVEGLVLNPMPSPTAPPAATEGLSLNPVPPRAAAPPAAVPPTPALAGVEGMPLNAVGAPPPAAPSPAPGVGITDGGISLNPLPQPQRPPVAAPVAPVGTAAAAPPFAPSPTAAPSPIVSAPGSGFPAEGLSLNPMPPRPVVAAPPSPSPVPVAPTGTMPVDGVALNPLPQRTADPAAKGPDDNN